MLRELKRLRARPERAARVLVLLLGVFITPLVSSQQSEKAELLAPDGAANDKFGLAVAAEGSFVAVGAPEHDGIAQSAGALYVFRLEGVEWVLDSDLVGSNVEFQDDFGFAVAMDGDRIAASAVHDNDGGAVYIFQREGDEWVEETRLAASDGDPGDELGSSVDIEGDVVVAGAEKEFVPPNPGTSHGAVYVFRFDGTDWIEESKLISPTPASRGFFGSCVTVSGDRMVIGESGEDRVYAFRLEAGQWLFEMELVPAVLTGSFGSDLALDGEWLLAGSDNDDEIATDSGSVVVFKRSGVNWIEQEKLVASDAQEGLSFGSGVMLKGTRAVVGAAQFGTGPGAGYIFRREGFDWIEEAKLIGSDAEDGDRVGGEVGLSDTAVVLSASRHDHVAEDAGAAYVYGLDLAFVRGDADADGGFNGLVDALFLLGYQFVPGSPAPVCEDAADADDDGTVNGLVDGLYMLNFQFIAGSPPPPPPTGSCGEDPTDDSLTCLTYPCP